MPLPQLQTQAYLSWSVLQGPLSWDRLHPLTLWQGRKKISKLSKSKALCPWRRLEGKPFPKAVTVTFFNDTEVSTMGMRIRKFSLGKFSCGEKAQLGTPTDCLNFPNRLLLDVVICSFTWMLHPRGACLGLSIKIHLQLTASVGCLLRMLGTQCDDVLLSLYCFHVPLTSCAFTLVFIIYSVNSLVRNWMYNGHRSLSTWFRTGALGVRVELCLSLPFQ